MFKTASKIVTEPIGAISLIQLVSDSPSPETVKLILQAIIAIAHAVPYIVKKVKERKERKKNEPDMDKQEHQ